MTKTANDLDRLRIRLGQVRKENQFGLPDDFSNIHVTVLSRTSHPASGFPVVFHNTDKPLFGDQQICLHDEGEARNFNISALRGRNRRSVLVAVM